MMLDEQYRRRSPPGLRGLGGLGGVYLPTVEALPPRSAQEGPFVFGVHGPSQFRLRSRLRDDSYDCSDDDKSVMDSESHILYCDKKISIKSNKSEGGAFRTRDRDRDSRRRRRAEEPRPPDTARDKIKCVLVGDGAVGKTSLITSYAQNVFQYDYKPTAFDNYNVVVEVDNRPISVEICDTAGQDSMEGLRELCYPGTDVIILCFSVVKPESFQSAAMRWAPGVSAVKAPLVLVGTQSDLRDNYSIITDLKVQGKSPVSESEARCLASALHAPYIETSSKTRSRLKEAFDSAILAALPVNKKKNTLWKKICCLS